MSPAVESRSASILVVDDERAVADLYATWLDAEHDVTVVTDGASALEAIDESVDVVLLDRQMPSLTGDDVLGAIEDRGLDPWVVMITAVDSDLDIVELPVDDYLRKPVDRADVLGIVEDILAREQYDDDLQEYFAMAAKKASLETAKPGRALERSEEYREVSERVAALEEEAAASATAVEDPESLFRDFPSGE